MKVIYNRLIPFRGFKAVNLFGAVFVREGQRLTRADCNHEAIHTAQMRELWYAGFYIAYLLEWLWRLVFRTRTAYRGISFEREARANERRAAYLKTRRRFAMWRKKGGGEG